MTSRSCNLFFWTTINAKNHPIFSTNTLPWAIKVRAPPALFERLGLCLRPHSSLVDAGILGTAGTSFSRPLVHLNLLRCFSRFALIKSKFLKFNWFEVNSDWIG